MKILGFENFCPPKDDLSVKYKMAGPKVSCIIRGCTLFTSVFVCSHLEGSGGE